MNEKYFIFAILYVRMNQRGSAYLYHPNKIFGQCRNDTLIITLILVWHLRISSGERSLSHVVFHLDTPIFLLLLPVRS